MATQNRHQYISKGIKTFTETDTTFEYIKKNKLVDLRYRYDKEGYRLTNSDLEYITMNINYECYHKTMGWLISFDDVLKKYYYQAFNEDRNQIESGIIFAGNLYLAHLKLHNRFDNKNYYFLINELVYSDIYKDDYPSIYDNLRLLDLLISNNIPTEKHLLEIEILNFVPTLDSLDSLLIKYHPKLYVQNKIEITDYSKFCAILAEFIFQKATDRFNYYKQIQNFTNPNELALFVGYDLTGYFYSESEQYSLMYKCFEILRNKGIEI